MHNFIHTCGCERRFHPVCGSDGITYDSECNLQCAKENKTGLKLLYLGTCCPKDLCPEVVQPVCDNYGRTHQNECRFHYHKCLLKKLQNKRIYIEHAGECRPEERQNEDCSKIFCNPENDGPICDEFGNTHNSTCKFDQLNCKRRNDNQEEIIVAYHAPCSRNDTELSEQELVLLQTLREVKLEELKNLNRTTVSTPEITTTSQILIPRPKHEKRKKRKRTKTEKHPRNPSHKKALASKTRPRPEDGWNSNGEDDEVPPTTVEEPFTPISTIFMETTVGEKQKGMDRTLPEAAPTTISPMPTPGPLEETILGRAEMEKGPKRKIVKKMQKSPWDLSQPCSAVACNKKWVPVCDHQGRTHKNLCLFKFYACKVYRHDAVILEVAHEGECRETQVYKGEDQPCGVCSTTKEKTPICDNMNQTHPSLCHLSVWNCQMELKKEERRILVHIGSCNGDSPVFSEQEEMCPESCSSKRLPVCDESMFEHKNLCTFQMKHCQARKAGRRPPGLAKLSACPKIDKPQVVTPEIDQGCPTPRCSEESSPVCDSLGKLHLNDCLFEHEKCKATLRGVELKKEPATNCAKCQFECPTKIKGPICGDNYVTYDNQCLFEKAKCMNSTLAPLFKGSCALCFNEPCPVLDENATDDLLVCDQNGQTRSRCEFNMLHCVLAQNFGFNLSAIHEGRCCASKDNCASAPRNPLCASDDKTYDNICLFEIARCQKMKQMGIELLLINEGECPIKHKKLNQRSSDPGVDSNNADNSVQETTSTTMATFASTTATTESPTTTQPDVCDPGFRCGHDYFPVCGSDNQTYTNACELKKAKCMKNLKLDIIYEGECCPTDCPTYWSPVCDSDNRSHQNLCFFGLARCLETRKYGKDLTISKFEMCSEKTECEECGKMYQPVCGSNEETYVNECELDRYNCLIEKNVTSGVKVERAYEGECCSTKSCSLTYEPLCDSRGQTHPNDCAFKKSQCLAERNGNITVDLAYKGQCCQQECEDTNHPVCDGKKTHKNMCKFRAAQCEAERLGEVLLLAYIGECCTLQEGNCQKSGALCDSDGETHQNLCQFEERQCIMERNLLKNLSIVHTGECCKIESCGRDVEPVCDSNGGTHASVCHFKNTKCIHDKLHPNMTLQFEYSGQCCPSNCRPDWEPVCDQHGRVYKNTCFFQLKSCEMSRRSGGVLLETPCPDRKARSYNVKRLSDLSSFPVGSRIYHH
ncbi:unnamed protein product, partial [Mesorhabditis spiculigera]